MLVKTKILVAVTMLSGATTAAYAAPVSFAGDTVNVADHFPDRGTVYIGQANQVAPTTFLFPGDDVNALVSADSVSLKFTGNLGSYKTEPFNGYIFNDLTASNIIGVTLNNSLALQFTADRLSFSPNSLSFDLGGLDFGVGNVITANVVFAPIAAAVPEAATWAMMILGMGAIGFAMRRRKNVSTSVKFA